MPDFVKFPQTREEKSVVKSNFLRNKNFHDAIGIIDGTHVEIVAPPKTDVNHPPFVYINRKGKYSINVMVISDSNHCIIGCDARYPGSVHDASVWRVSSIRDFLQRQYNEGDQ